MRFWQRWRDPLNLNTKLEERRSKPRPEFVQKMTDELSGSRRPALPRMRLALAAALTLMMLVAAGSIGGGATAASFKRPVTSVIKSVHQVLEGKKATQRQGKRLRLAHEGDNDQYEEQRRQCRRAVIQAHHAYHIGEIRSHEAFHQFPYTTATHLAFHQGRSAAHGQYHLTVVEPAERACEQIGR